MQYEPVASWQGPEETYALRMVTYALRMLTYALHTLTYALHTLHGRVRKKTREKRRRGTFLFFF
jgi:hypothetical protein